MSNTFVKKETCIQLVTGDGIFVKFKFSYRVASQRGWVRVVWPYSSGAVDSVEVGSLIVVDCGGQPNGRSPENVESV